MSGPPKDHVFYRIGDDGEWEQHRTEDWPHYRAARWALQLLTDAFERTDGLPSDERERELEKVTSRLGIS